MSNISKIFGPRPAHALDPSTLLSFPEACPLPDTEHPTRIDWRAVRLWIDLTDWRWYHLTIEDKPGGRDAPALIKSPVFEAQGAALLNRAMTKAFPDREKEILQFPDISIGEAYAVDGAPTLGFHVNAKSQAFGRALSHHQRLALSRAWGSVSV